jgi:hypothetical protein
VLGPIGSPHPIDVITSAASGRWIGACQARHDNDGIPGIRVRRFEHGFGGDKLTPYLIRGGGEGIAIDGFVAASSDDRWIAVVRGGVLVLIDDISGHEQVLPGADVRGELSTARQIAAFDVDNTHLSYARIVDGHGSVVIHDLASQAEHATTTLPGIVWQVQEQPPSAWLRVTYLRRSVRPNEFPHLVASPAAGRQCRGFDLLASVDPIFDARADAWVNPSTGELQNALPIQDRARVHEAAEQRDALPSFGTNVLSSVDRSYRITNSRTGVVTELPGVTGPVGRQAGSVVAIGTTVVDLASARVLGGLPHPPLAVDAGGHALMAAAKREVGEVGLDEPAIGPLHWVSPTPIATDSRTR